MAYQEFTISAMADIPVLVADFAAALGWERVGLVLRHPDYGGPGVPGGLAFTLSADANNLRVTCDAPGNQAYVRQPILTNPGSSSTYNVAPSKLMLIGMMTPAPYVAVVIQFGYNLYRHLYLGFMEKFGNYTGGEVIAGHNGPHIAINDSGLHWLAKNGTHPLFRGGRSSLNTRSNCGGVHVIHADNATAWRNFRSLGTIDSTFRPTDMYDGAEATGGLGDSYNDMFVARGVNTLAGASVLAPINLFATQMVTSDVRYIPIGRPAGVRLINIANLDPEAVTTIGAETWRSFAALSKRPDLTMPSWDGGAGSSYRQYETSYNLGYAYRSA